MPSKAAKTPTKKTTAKRATVASLAVSLKSLESRLKGADTKNRNAIKALEKVVAEVKTSARQSTITQKAALTRGLNQLEIRIETYLERSAEQARASVRSELTRVTASGANLSTLETAVAAAHARLDAIDTTQRTSLARLNRHIADLATSVENRLTGESNARKAESAAIDAKVDSVSTRVDRIEEDTANALEAVGSKVAEFAAILDQRAQNSDVDTADRLADLAKETQAEFNAAQSDLTTRLEALEVIAAAWSPIENSAPANPYLPSNLDDPRIDDMTDMIRGLQEELGRMHARIASVQNTPQPAPIAPVAALAPTNVIPLSEPVALAQDNPYAAAAQALEASSNGAQSSIPAKPAANNDPRKSHIPQEFDPNAFAQLSAPLPTVAEVIMPSPPPLSTPPVLPPQAPPMASAGTHAPVPAPDWTTTEGPADELLSPAPLPVQTYDDPAYAEHDDMRAERIGGETSKSSRTRSSLPKLPISGRNLRVGALAVGVGVVGLFAVKTILGSPKTDTPQIASTQSLEAPSASGSINGENTFGAQDAALPEPIAPLGQYAETQPPTFIPGEESTLDAAVAAGDPIAQFQKGLAQLQAGQMEEGARLIRLSANRNQPAAQYRLAKLYESGTGLAQDIITARELTERAARGGNRIAMHDLGNYHAEGKGGLKPDMNAALDWFTKAAERGVVDSQFNVAFLREGNAGIPTDAETALFWYHVAARQGDQGAPDRIAVLEGQMDASTKAAIKSRADRFNPKPVDEAANGVFRNVAWAKPAGTSAQDKSAEILKIRDAQTLLTELGYQVGAPDGIAGAKTREAIKLFETVNGMPETGQITDELIDKLEVAVGA